MLIYEIDLLILSFLYFRMPYFVLRIYNIFSYCICLNYEFKDMEVCNVAHFNLSLSFKLKIKVFSELPVLPCFH